MTDTPNQTADLRCPDCGLAWWLFAPARVHGSDTLVRCIERKRVYETEMESITK